MKDLIKKAVVRILASCARTTIRLKKPLVIGITGSVGKTTTKEAIAAALSPHFSVGKSEGNFNSEYGLPCKICGMNWSYNPLEWLANFFYRWPRRILAFPKILVLEMGSDKPGDIEHLTSIARPDISVICAIGVAHLEKFGSSEALLREKFQLFGKLDPQGLAIANIDDSGAKQALAQYQGKKISYGIEGPADFCAKDIQKSGDRTSFSVNYLGNAEIVSIPFIGKPAILSALAAYAVGINLGLTLQKVSQGLKSWQPIAGRMNAYDLDGVFILDDTYNANPQSTSEALDTLAECGGQKWAVLGDMLELGAAETKAHRACALKACQVADKVILVGERYLGVLEELQKGKVQWFPVSESAAAKIAKEANSGDSILVKGSKKMKMFKIIDALKEAANTKLRK